MSIAEVLSDTPYLEPNTVRIAVHHGLHHGKFWQHSHAFFEFVYVYEGFTLHSYNGKTTVLTAGDLFVIYPGDVHSYTAAYQNHVYNILFYPDELDGVSDEIMKLPGIDWNRRPDTGSELSIVRVGLNERRELTGLLERMFTERKERRAGWELNLRGMLISFLVTYSRLVSADAVNRTKSDNRLGYSGYIFNVLKFVEEHFSEDIGTAELAKAVGLSSDYLTKQFKSVMSMTPSEYIRRFRIAKSMDLLNKTDMSIADVAAAVGFGDISLFSRVFKQNIGVSPAMFRKE